LRRERGSGVGGGEELVAELGDFVADIVAAGEAEGFELADVGFEGEAFAVELPGELRGDEAGVSGDGAECGVGPGSDGAEAVELVEAGAELVEVGGGNGGWNVAGFEGETDHVEGAGGAIVGEAGEGGIKVGAGGEAGGGEIGLCEGVEWGEVHGVDDELVVVVEAVALAGFNLGRLPGADGGGHLAGEDAAALVVREEHGTSVKDWGLRTERRVELTAETRRARREFRDVEAGARRYGRARRGCGALRTQD
jgi:hypothetical protein